MSIPPTPSSRAPPKAWSWATMRRPAASCSARSSPAPSAASPSPRSSRACSPSTPPKAPAPRATGLARSSSSTRPSSSPTTRSGSKKGAVVPWAKSNPPSPYYMQVLGSLAKAFDFGLDTPWAICRRRSAIRSSTERRGSPVTPAAFVDGKKSYDVKKPFRGHHGNLNRRMLQTESAWMKEELGKYQSSQACETCHGAQLKPEALAVKVSMRDISYATRLSVVDALAFFADLPRTSATSSAPSPSAS
ncbi:hypothetical protein AB5I41_27410 [Sphingomonas sp. MMS24-JH45]